MVSVVWVVRVVVTTEAEVVGVAEVVGDSDTVGCEVGGVSVGVWLLDGVGVLVSVPVCGGV